MLALILVLLIVTLVTISVPIRTGEPVGWLAGIFVGLQRTGER